MNAMFVILLMLWQATAMAETDDLASLWVKLKRSNLEIKEAEKRRLREEFLHSAQLGAFSPQISFQSTLDQKSTDGTEPRVERVTQQNSLRAEQVLIDKDKFSTTAVRAINRDIAAEDLIRIQEKLLLELCLAYYGVLEKTSLLQTMRKSLEGPIKILEEHAYKVLKAGVRSSREVSPLLLQVNQLRLQVRQLESEGRQAKTQLSLLVGEPLEPLKSMDEHSGPRVLKLPEPESSSEERLETLQIALKEAQISQSTADYWPRMSLYGSWEIKGRSQEKIESQPWSASNRSGSEVGLVLSIPLWSGLSTFHERRAALSDKEANLAQIQASRLARNALIADGPEQLQEDLDRYHEAERLARLAGDLLLIARRQQVAGVASFDDILGPELQVLQMKLIRTGSFFAYYKNEAIELSRRGGLVSRIEGK